MTVKVEQIGEVMVYGEWDDVLDNQFLVCWRESGSTCTVICLSGYDYGGGVTKGSANVPIKEMEEAVKTLTGSPLKRYVEELVEAYP